MDIERAVIKTSMDWLVVTYEDLYMVDCLWNICSVAVLYNRELQYGSVIFIKGMVANKDEALPCDPKSR
jgi:hypothetical protein